MKKIVVPEGMLKAALENFDRRTHAAHPDTKSITCALEAALLWLSEHPQVPTDEQAQSLWYLESPEMDEKDHAKAIAVEWQRRCFQEEEREESRCSICNSPIWKLENGIWSHWGGYPDHKADPVEEEPEIPAEIEDLIWSKESEIEYGARVADMEAHNEQIFEAYRRGLRKGEKK